MEFEDNPFSRKSHDLGGSLEASFLDVSVQFSSVTQSCLTLCDPMNRSTPGLPAAAAKSLQSCPTLCDHIDSSPPCSPVPGILQARTLEWGAISFSNA